MKYKLDKRWMEALKKYFRQSAGFYRTNQLQIKKAAVLTLSCGGVAVIAFVLGYKAGHSVETDPGYKIQPIVDGPVSSGSTGTLTGTPSYVFPPYATDSQATPANAELMGPDMLNLAYLYEEGVDTADPSNSYAGRLYQKLVSLDAEWISGIYDLFNYKPDRLAAQFGLSSQSVTASDGTVPKFSNIHIRFTDGNGSPASSYSNGKEILSMANMLHYYGALQDMDSLERYETGLWKNSHSCYVRAGDIYYCDGSCLNGESGNREGDSGRAVVESGETKNGETGSGESGTARAGLSFAKKEATEEAGASAGEREDSDGERAAEATEDKVGERATETAGDNAGEHTTAASDKAGEPVAVEGKAKDSEPATGAAKTQETETDPESMSAGGLNQMVASGNTAVETVSPKSRGAGRSCPGHIDFTVSVAVKGLTESGGLCKLDSTPVSGPGESAGWKGWNSAATATALELSRQDWFERYGINTTDLALRTPLTSAEIDLYMSMAPENASQMRKDFIKYALASVGKIPYYWGGKPQAPGYGGNHFGTVVSPDVDGRFLKGLDCSGWINWVYWSVTGQGLGAESTSTLLSSGKAISKDQLQPGDICIRTGSMAHVVIFMGWGEDGKMLCIQETSGNINNVEVGINDSEWQSFRRIID